MCFHIIDECKDNARHEQLSCCIRFCKGAVVTERFLGLIRLEKDLRAKAITEQLLPCYLCYQHMELY